MVHRNELVMPAAEAGAFRSMLSGQASGTGATSGASGGDTHHHYNVAINAVDSASVKSLFSNNAQALYAALKKGASRGDHL